MYTLNPLERLHQRCFRAILGVHMITIHQAVRCSKRPIQSSWRCAFIDTGFAGWAMSFVLTTTEYPHKCSTVNFYPVLDPPAVSTKDALHRLLKRVLQPAI